MKTKYRIVLYCVVLVSACLFGYARHVNDPDRLISAKIRAIERAFERRRNDKHVSTIRYELTGTWTAPKHGFVSPYPSESEFPPEEVVNEYSAEVLLDVASMHFQLTSDSFIFHTARPPVGTTIRNRDLFLDWDGTRHLVYERAEWERKQRGEVSFWQPDIMVYDGDQRGVRREFLPFLLAHGHLMLNHLPSISSNLSESLKFVREEEFDDHDCIVLVDVEDRRQFWFARDMDYAIIKCCEMLGGSQPTAEITIEYETKNDKQVVKSFRYVLHHGREVGSRIINAQVNHIEWDLKYADHKRELQLETGMIWVDRRDGYAGYIIGRNQEMFPSQVVWHVAGWLP